MRPAAAPRPPGEIADWALAIAAELTGPARNGLVRRAEAVRREPARARSLEIDCERIAGYLGRSPDKPAAGLKALLRAARRSAEHQAARGCRDRVAERGPLAWAVPPDLPERVLGFAIRALSSSRDLIAESRDVRNCIADFEDGLSEGHYLAFSLDGHERMPRHTVAVAHEGAGRWSVYGVQDRSKGACRDAKDAAQAICDAIEGWEPPIRQESASRS